MTTVVRNNNMVYSDSCYGTPIGTERTRVFGEPKFFINKNKTVLASICGNIPGTETTAFLTTQFMDMVEQYMGDYKNQSTIPLTSIVEQFYEHMSEVRPKLDEFYTLAFFTKDFTVQLAVKVNKNVKRIRIITYGPDKELVFGSGASWWLAQKSIPNITVPDKFKYIYRLDSNSGGTVNVFDLNSLKEIAGDSCNSNPGK